MILIEYCLKEINWIKNNEEFEMINFASLFNQFRGSSNNALNEILEQKEVTLSKLIDEDSFMN